MYYVHVNGQLIGTLDRTDIEKRSHRWKKLGATVKVVETSTGVLMSLADFLAIPALAKGVQPPVVSAPSSKAYQVRVNGQIIRALDRAEIERRFTKFLSLGTQVEVADDGGQNFATLADFLTKPPVSASPAPVQPVPRSAISPAAFDANVASSTAPAPPLPRSGTYQVRVNGQVIGSLDRDEIERRFSKFLRLGTQVEVADSGGQNFVPLADFLASLPLPPLPPVVPPSIQPAPRTGTYQVRVNGQVIGSLDRDEIERRFSKFLKLGTQVEVADEGDQNFVPLADFLASSPPPPAPPTTRGAPSPAAVAALTLITLNFYWLYWLWSTYKRIRLINPAATRISPSRAWGFLFIPIFGAFWFIRIAFDLPRAILRIQGSATTGMRFGRGAATAMFLLGSLWPLGLNYVALGLPAAAAILWVAGCEALLLGFIAYCQASLNRASLTSAGRVPSRDRRPERLLLGAVGVAACCAAIVLYISWRRTPELLAQQAQEAFAAGDFGKAASLLEKMTTPAAKLELASLYQNGLGVEKDQEKAVSLLTDAANAGLPLAKTTLGLWYANGEGVKADPTGAVTWYRKAASQGDTYAAVFLGLAYAAGDGVDQDPAEAYMWFAVAEKRGNDYATSEKAIVGDLLTPEQKGTAEDRASVEIEHESGGQP